MAGTLPPIFPITADDHGGYVAVSVYTLLCLTLVLVVARLFTRWYIARVIHADDILLGVAMGLAIFQSAFVQLAIDHGLGKRISTVSTGEYDAFQKYIYATQILLIATVTCSKLSLSLLFRTLTAEGSLKYTGHAVIAVIILWAVSSIFALAFRCSLPHPWIYSQTRCIDQGALVTAIGVVNILTDILLVLIPCIVLHQVQITRSKRLRIMAMLATRFLVCIATGLEIHYALIALHDSDRTWASIASVIWDQAMMNLSIITTAVPSLGRLVVELKPSLNAFTFTKQHTYSPNTNYIVSSMSSHFRSEQRNMGEDLGTRTSVHGRGQSHKEDSDSTKELVMGEPAQQMSITKTVDFEIR
ncbi:hypothetical protein ASPZODRAFT_128795 [Penicilliopsis zonata CBS 506.65]|uniref:Rhodopsin domain-containing protein n=1 Tax=Penicilliopsis zonata CBS 506.65 TaxID=1073090 RepID=A0A1L9SSU7_9EURO|nr:hypothetical protein ASPZODRAFT_128795 [Penicilliopsis zonata CBS 506.65]OJJ50177.1 hypothetical protein ASPZODRAFT_128795 [Penicilliopsis zonata CBS 506.65]